MWTIVKKELARFFGDKTLFFSTVLLPGLMIFVLYSFMGKAMVSQFQAEEAHVYEIATIHQPESFGSLMRDDSFQIKEVRPEEKEEIQQNIEEQNAELLVVFPEDFDEDVAAYDSMTAIAPAPNIEIYYNSASTESQTAYSVVQEVLSQYETALANKFDVNAGENMTYDLATDKDTSARFFSMMMPMLMMIFLFTGCMAIAPESIAGEKERGTISTLLVTPMKRSELAIGKIISLSIIGLLSGLSSFIGTMLAFPAMMGGAAGDEGILNANVYNIMDYVLLLLVILTTVLIIIGAISVISGFSKSVKEAGTAVTPLMILVMVISITTMMGGGAPKEPYLYLIPFYNSVQCMNGIFSFTIVPMNFVITIICNLVYTMVLVGILAKMFDSEKIMYNV